MLDVDGRGLSGDLQAGSDPFQESNSSIFVFGDRLAADDAAEPSLASTCLSSYSAFELHSVAYDTARSRPVSRRRARFVLPQNADDLLFSEP
jgi:hypothetical protein